MEYFTYIPLRNRRNWKWFRARYLYFLNEPKELADLIKTNNLPKFFRKDISNIVSGKRKPNKNSSAKLKNKSPLDRFLLLEAIFDYNDELSLRLDRYSMDKNEIANNKTPENVSVFRQLESDFYNKFRVNICSVDNKKQLKIIKNNFFDHCYDAKTTPTCMKKAYENFKLDVFKWIEDDPDHIANFQ